MEAASRRAEEGVLGFEEEIERGRERRRRESGFDIEIGLKWPVSLLASYNLETGNADGE